MKNIITIIAFVLILAIFLTQITINELTHTKLVYCEEVVNTTMQQAREEGCITTAMVNDMKTKIAAKAGCEEDDVVITSSIPITMPAERGNLIDYKVEYFVKGVIGGGSILGIQDADNKMKKVISGAVVSEYVGP